MSLEDRDQVLKDQRRRRSTSPAETNTLAKVKMKPMALYHSQDSLAILRTDTSKPAKEPLQEQVRLSLIKILQLGYDNFLPCCNVIFLTIARVLLFVGLKFAIMPT